MLWRISRHGNPVMAIRRQVSALLLCLIGATTLAGTDETLSPLPALERTTMLAVPRQMADFTLTDQNGRPRAFSSLLGAPVLVFFGFTHCPAICPAAMTKLKMLHGSDGGALKSARVVMISVDGERDAPAVMKRYLASFSPDFIGLTGNPRTVADIAARFSAVAYKEKPDQRGNYEYYHSSQVFLVDGNGRLRASFDDATVESMATLTRLLLKEKSSTKGR